MCMGGPPNCELGVIRVKEEMSILVRGAVDANHRRLPASTILSERGHVMSLNENEPFRNSKKSALDSSETKESRGLTPLPGNTPLCVGKARHLLSEPENPVAPGRLAHYPLRNCKGVVGILLTDMSSGCIIAGDFDSDKGDTFNPYYLQTLAVSAIRVHSTALSVAEKMGGHRVDRLVLCATQGYVLISRVDTMLVIAICDTVADSHAIFAAFLPAWLSE